MKRHLLPLLLLIGVIGLPTLAVQAQDKPALNTAPPGLPPPAPTRPAAPVPEPAPAEPRVAPEPAPPVQPTQDAPSGLNFPNRNPSQTGSTGDSDRPLKRKFLYTNVGLGYTSSDLSRFNISAAPAIGFRITDKFAIGPGISYAYSSFSLSQQNFYNIYGRAYPTPNGNLTESGSNSLSTSSLGAKIFAQYIVYNEFFVHGEYEVTNAQLPFQDGRNYLFKQNRTVTSALAGLGYRSSLGENSAVDIVGLYNFSNSVFSLYPGFVVRFSFLFNFGN